MIQSEAAELCLIHKLLQTWNVSLDSDVFGKDTITL